MHVKALQNRLKRVAEGNGEKTRTKKNFSGSPDSEAASELASDVDFDYDDPDPVMTGYICSRFYRAPEVLCEMLNYGTTELSLNHDH